jgi:uncharacterized protein (DUF433 family)
MVYDYQRHFARDPGVGGGQTVKGTRVLLRTVLDSLAEGAGADDILRSFPTLKDADVRAAIAFAAAGAAADLRVPALPDVR